MWLPLRGSRCWSCCPLSALNLTPQDSESCPSSFSTATKNIEQRHQRQLRPPIPTSTKKWWIGSCTYEHMNSAVTKRVKRNKLVGYLLSLFHTCTLILNCIQHWVRFRIQHRTTGKMCRTANGHVEDWCVSRKIQIPRVEDKER